MLNFVFRVTGKIISGTWIKGMWRGGGGGGGRERELDKFFEVTFIQGKQ